MLRGEEVSVNDLLPIGRFSRLCRSSVKALRHYEREGLLHPAHVDPDSGYRYYAVAQALEAERIRVLRSLDLPIAEIRELLRERDAEATRGRLEAHGRRIRERIDEQQRALAYLERLIEEEDMSHEIQLRDLSEQSVVSMRENVKKEDIGAFMGRALRKLYVHAGLRFARPAGPPFSVYHDEEWPEEGMDMEVCLPVSRELRGKDPVRSQRLEGCRAACLVHAGSYDQVGQAYCTLGAWLKDKGLEPDGPPREVYLVGPGRGRDPADYRTEIVWPVREASA